MNTTKNIVINFSITRSFISDLMHVGVAGCGLIPRSADDYEIDTKNCDVQFVTTEGKIGNIKQVKAGIMDMYRIDYDGKNIVTLKPNEYEVIRPFRADTFNEYIKRLEELKHFYNKIKDTKRVRPAVFSYLVVALKHFQEMFHDGTFERVLPGNIMEAQVVVLDNPDLHDLKEQVFFAKDANNNIIKFSSSLN